MRTAVILAAAVLSGCAAIVGEGEIPNQYPVEPINPAGFVQPHLGDPSPWVGKTRDELVEALGPPDATYEARHWLMDYDALIPAISYVYVQNGAACVDAYVVDMYTYTVIKYYCR